MCTDIICHKFNLISLISLGKFDEVGVLLLLIAALYLEINLRWSGARYPWRCDFTLEDGFYHVR